jgi:O-antigen/teichoic acid export membrane protein/polysaccharide pyruvyl transferase WcaK-like protein
VPLPESRTRTSDAAGTIWAYIQGWAARGITLLVFFVLARLLTPAEFGTFAVAMFFLTLGEVFVEQLFGHVIVQREALTETHLSSAFWATMLIGTALALATLAAAPAFAALFGGPGVQPVIMALAPIFGFMALSSVPAALLRRELDYRTLTRRTTLSNLLSGTTAIVAAANGLGVWTFVLQQLVYYAVSTWILWRHEAWRPKRIFRREALAELVGFSSRIMLVKLLDLIETRVLELVIARHLGIVAVGNYALASRAQQSATQLLAAPLWESSISIFARKQSNRAALEAALKERVLLVALVIMPAFLFAAASADALVPAVFGSQWTEAVAPFQILCLLGALRSLLFLLGAAMQSVGAAHVSLSAAVLRTTGTVGALFFGLSYGPAGVAACLVIGQAVSLPVILGAFQKELGFSLGKVFRQLVVPVPLALVAALVGLATMNTLDPHLSAILRALISLSASIGTWLILTAGYFHRSIPLLIGKIYGLSNRVRLSGAFGERNFGDDLLMWHSYHWLITARPGLNVSIATTEPSTANYIKKSLPQVRIDRRFRSLSHYWTPEILAGGTQFYSFPEHSKNKPEQRSRLIRLFLTVRNDGLFRTLLRALALALPFEPKRIAVGIGIGPFQAGNELASHSVLSQLHHIWVRDQESREYPAKWGLPNIDVGADICFADGLFDFTSARANIDPNLIGVVIRGGQFATTSTEFQYSVLLTCRRLEERGFKVRVFAFCVPVDQEGIAYFERHGFEVATWDPDRLNAIDYLRTLSECRFFISARFHGVVVGALLGKPTIGIALDPKVKHICEKLGLGDFVWEPPFDLEGLWSLTLSMDTNCDELSREVATNRQHETAVANQMMSRATSVLFE